MVENNLPINFQNDLGLKKIRICNTDFWKMSIPEFIRFYELANFGDDIQEEFNLFDTVYPYIYQGVIRAFRQDGSQEYEYCFAIDLDIYDDDRPLVIPYEVYRWMFQINTSAESPFCLYSDNYVHAVKIFIISRKFKIFLKSSINILYYLCQHIFRDFDTIDIQDIDLRFYWEKVFSFYSESMLYGIHAKDKPDCIQEFMPVLLLYPSNFQALINSHPWRGIKPIIDEFVYLGVYEREELKKIYHQEDIDYPLTELINPDIVLSAYTMENLRKLYDWVFNGKTPFSPETLQFMQQIQDSASKIEKIHTESIYQSPSYNSGGLNNPEIQNHYYQFWPLQMSDDKLSRWVSWVNERKHNNQYKSKVGEPFEIPESRFAQKRLISRTPHLILGNASVPQTWDELIKVSNIKTFRFTSRPFPYRTKYSTSRDWNFVPVPDQPIEPFKDMEKIPDLSVEPPYYDDFSDFSNSASFATRFDIIREFGDFYHEKFGHTLLVECSHCNGVYLFSYHPSLKNYDKKYVCVYNRTTISRAQFNSELMLLFFHKDPDYILKNVEYFEMEKENYILKFDALKVSSCLKEEPLFAYPIEYLLVSMDQLRKIGLDVDLIVNDVLINNMFNQNFYQSHDYNDSIQKYYRYNKELLAYEEAELIEHILPEQIKKIIDLEKTGFRVPEYMKALVQHKFARENPELFEKYVEYMNKQKIQDVEYEDENEYKNEDEYEDEDEKGTTITFETPSAKIVSYPITAKVFASSKEKEEEGEKEEAGGKGEEEAGKTLSKINLTKIQFFYEKDYSENNISYLSNLLKQIIFNLPKEKSVAVGQQFTLNTMIHCPVVSNHLTIDCPKQFANTSAKIKTSNISMIPGEMFFIYSFHNDVFNAMYNGSKSISGKFYSEIYYFEGSKLDFSIIPMNFNISIQQLKNYQFFNNFSRVSQIPEKSYTTGFSRNFLYNYLITSRKISENPTFEDTFLGKLQSIMHNKATSCSTGLFNEYNKKFNETLKEYVKQNKDEINLNGYSISDIIFNAYYFFSTFVKPNNLYSKIRKMSRTMLKEFKNYYATYEFLIAHGLFEFPKKIEKDDEEKIRIIEAKLNDPSESSKYSVFLKNPFVFMGHPHKHPYPSPNINEYKYRLLFIDRLEKIESILIQDSNGILSRKSIIDTFQEKLEVISIINSIQNEVDTFSKSIEMGKERKESILNVIDKFLKEKESILKEKESEIKDLKDKFLNKKLHFQSFLKAMKNIIYIANFEFCVNQFLEKIAKIYDINSYTSKKQDILKDLNKLSDLIKKEEPFKKFASDFLKKIIGYFDTSIVFSELLGFYSKSVSSTYTNNAFEYMLVIGGMLRKFKEYVNSNGEINLQNQTSYELFLLMMECNFLLNQYYMIAGSPELKPINKDVLKLASLFVDIPLNNLNRCFEQKLNILNENIDRLKGEIISKFKDEDEELLKLNIFNLDLTNLSENTLNQSLKQLNSYLSENEIKSPLIDDYIQCLKSLLEKNIDSVQTYLIKNIKKLSAKLKKKDNNIKKLLDNLEQKDNLDAFLTILENDKGLNDDKNLQKLLYYAKLLFKLYNKVNPIEYSGDIILFAFSKEIFKIKLLGNNNLKDLKGEISYFTKTFGTFNKISALLSHFYQSHYIHCNLKSLYLDQAILGNSIFKSNPLLVIDEFQTEEPQKIFMGGKCPVEIVFPECVQKELEDYKMKLNEKDKNLFNFAIKRIENRALEYFIHNSLMLNKANLMYDLNPKKINVNNQGLGNVNHIIASGKNLKKAAQSSFGEIEKYEKKITDFLSSTNIEDSQLIDFIANARLPWRFNMNRVRGLRNRYDKPSGVENNQYQYSLLGAKFNRREFAKTFLKFHGFVWKKIKESNLKDNPDLDIILKYLKDNRLTPLLLFEQYLDKIKGCFYPEHIALIKEISQLLNNSANTSPSKDGEEEENKENPTGEKENKQESKIDENKAKNLREDLLMKRYGITFSKDNSNYYQGSTLYILKLLALIYYSKIKKISKSKEQKQGKNAEYSEEIDEYEDVDESNDDKKDTVKDTEKDKKVEKEPKQNEPKEKGLSKDEIILSKILQILTVCDSSLFLANVNGDKNKENKENNNNTDYLDFLDNLPIILPNIKFQEVFGYQIAEFMSIQKNLDKIIEYFGESRYTSYSDVSRAIIRYRIAFLFIKQWKKENIEEDFEKLWEKLKPVSNSKNPYKIREKIKNSDFNITSEILKIYSTELKMALKFSETSYYPELKFKFNERKQCHLLPLHNKERGIGLIGIMENIAEVIAKKNTWDKDLGIEFDLAGHYFPENSKDLATFFDKEELEKIHRNKFFSFRPAELNFNNFKRNEKISKSGPRLEDKELKTDIEKVNKRINEVMNQLETLRKAEVLIAKIHYFGRGKYKIKDSENEYTEVWNYIIENYGEIKENLKKYISSNVIPQIPKMTSNEKPKFMKDMVSFADKLEEILKPEIEKRQNERTTLFTSIRNLNNKKKGIELYQKKINKQNTDIAKMNEYIGKIFSGDDFKLFRTYLTGSLVIKSSGNSKIVNPSNGIQSNSQSPKQNSLVNVFFAGDPQLNEYLKTSFEASKQESQESESQKSQESLVSSTLSKGETPTPIRVKIRLSSNLFDKIKNGATINNIQILTPKYPSRRCIANVCLAAFSDLARPKPKIITPSVNKTSPIETYNILNKIKKHISEKLQGNSVYMGIDDNRLNSLYTFTFSFMTEQDLDEIASAQSLPKLTKNLMTLNKLIVVNSSNSSNNPKTNSNDSNTNSNGSDKTNTNNSNANSNKINPISISIKEMEQIVLGCAGIRNLSQDEKNKINEKRQKSGLPNIEFHPFFEKLREHVLSNIIKPTIAQPDNPTEKVEPEFSDYLMAFIKYMAEKRDHLKKHIAGLQKKNKKQIQELVKSNKSKKIVKNEDDPSIKLDLSDNEQQRIFRRKTDKHNYYAKYTNVRKAIDDYISKVLAMTIYLIEPKVIAHEELKFSDKSVEEGGQGGYIKQISQSMFKNFETFSARIENWFNIEGQENNYIPEFVAVNATNTSKISFVNRYIKRLPLYLCRFDRKGDADYSYIINPPISESNISKAVKDKFFEIRCSHEEAAGNILYRGYEKINKENKDKSATDKPPPQPPKEIGYIKTGEG